MSLDILIIEQRDLLQLLLKLEVRFEQRNTNEKTHGYLNSLAQRLDDIFNKFETQHEKIVRKMHEESICVDDVPYMKEDTYLDFSEKFLTFKGKLFDLLPEHTSPMASTFVTPSSRSDTTISSDTRLPKISLPKFSGEYMEWIPFRDIYFTLVHQNDSLNKVQKFYYLKGTLSGEAANLIKSISATEANYDSAWHILESRYHNKRMLVGNLILKLFNIPKSDGGFQSIKTLLDSAQECLSSLRNLNINTLSWDPILIHLLVQKLDIQARKDWEQSLRSSTELPSREELFSFLERTFRTLESLNDGLSTTSKQKPSTKVNKTFTQSRKTSCNSGNFSKQNTISCSYCNGNHSLSKCFKFLALPLHSKNEFLSNKKVCRNCLVVGHNQNNCGSPFRCIICKQPHHTILHSEENQSSAVAATTSNSNHNEPPQVTTHNANSFPSVLLYTIRLNIRTKRGYFPLRALLDPGSQGSLISESVVQLLGLKKIKSHCKVIGIGNGSENLSKYFVNIDLYNRKHKPVLSCTALVLPTLSSYAPNPSCENISMPKLTNDSLADPLFFKSDPIDMILGSDISSRIKIASESFIYDNLFFQNTHFGWVFSGNSNVIRTNTVHIHNANLESILRSFWEQEEVVTQRKFTSDELACEHYFETKTIRTESGRYMVHLPFKSLLVDNTEPTIRNNVIGAFKRLRQLEISFSKRPQFAESYINFMQEYESLGHMTKVGKYPNDIRQNSYFLPHHGVLKESSTTTKLRVVFDGSCHLNNYKSLNEELSPGPALQNKLPGVITKWRRHKIAFSADIEKMFRQIDVCPEHRKFQQILWRFKPIDDISIYELNTVTYGTTSAPYLAIRVLHRLAHDFEIEFPDASKVLISDSYVDDIISGADNIENAITLQKDLCTLLEKGGCNLRKWITNSNELLQKIPEECRDPSVTLKFDRDNVVKTLGIQWNTDNDSFSFKVNIDDTMSATKRSILSESARLYDPLGWLTPSTLISKSIFKQLWEHGLDWDEKIPTEIENRWLKYRSSLAELANLKIPRWIRWSNESRMELHCFSDASNAAYAAVVYTRVISSDGIFVNILQSKSKVSPVKTVSIPRLELCAARLLVQLAQSVKESLCDVNIENIYYWSDSSTVLSWIQKHPSCWTVYVANRVADIQRLSNPRQWNYVPSALNPADCASRGVLAQDLIKDQTWWFGPQLLYKSFSYWPKGLSNLQTSEERVMTKVSTNTCINKIYPDILSRFSKLITLLRTSTLCLRFIHNCKNPKLKRTNVLKTSELNETLLRLIRLTQFIDFPYELKLLSENHEIRHSSLLKLMPFLDENGIIRVGGRLQNSDLSYNVKHPIILAKSNPLSKLIIIDSHERTLHGGVTLTMSVVNRKFWIVSGNQLAKSIIHKCIQCFRYSAKTSQQVMGNLPYVRLNVTRPFKHSGVDYAGPIAIKNSTLRSAVVSKGYICLFVCMVTKAIHLEAVSDLSTNSFLAAFRRFVSRRGACTDIYSDCGTNFVGASKELKILYNRNSKSLPDDLRQALSLNCTNWHFIPPASPNFGGLWEAGVKSVKHHLKRITHNRLLSFEELATLLCQIEGCLNSRPLCPLSSDPSDFDALTPAHFLVGEPIQCIQEESLLDQNINHLTRWKSIELLKQHFWKRWHREYLNRLQARPKWLKSKAKPKIGDLVLIADERCGPGQWLLGRIHDVHPGADGLIRVVSVLTKNKIMKRPISKISFLPDNSPECLENNNSNEQN